MKAKKIICFLSLLLLFSVLSSGLYGEDKKNLNLNSATIEELAEIPGMNQDLAKKIIEVREEDGEFVDMEELLDIPGINIQLLRTLKKHLFIESLDECNC